VFEDLLNFWPPAARLVWVLVRVLPGEDRAPAWPVPACLERACLWSRCHG
jgi:hypothetical protein